jgi:hypothetical protein
LTTYNSNSSGIKVECGVKIALLTLNNFNNTHFLLCLCHFHLNNVNQCYNSLRDLQLTISEDYFIYNDIERSNSYNRDVFGIVLFVFVSIHTNDRLTLCCLIAYHTHEIRIIRIYSRRLTNAVNYFITLLYDCISNTVVRQHNVSLSLV